MLFQRQHKCGARRSRAELHHLVAKAAVRQMPYLPPPIRADLLDGVALLLTDAHEQELARYTASLIRLTAEHDRKFFQQLTGNDL